MKRPRQPDSTRRSPVPARIYDYYLGGKDNFAADRAAAEKALSVVPQGRDVAHSNRQFLVRAVRYMASRGVAQFIDLGTGFPSPPSVHQTAAANLTVRPRVVYVDNDPMVTSHNQALLADSPVAAITAIRGDIRCPGQIFAGQELWNAIDFTQPVGVLFVAVLHFIPAEDDPHGSAPPPPSLSHHFSLFFFLYFILFTFFFFLYFSNYSLCARSARRWRQAASWPCRTSPATAPPRTSWPRSATPTGRPAHRRCSAAVLRSRVSSPAWRYPSRNRRGICLARQIEPGRQRFGSWAASG